MSNNFANFPGPNAPVLDPSGALSQPWLQFFLTLFSRTGGGGNPADILTVIAKLAAAQAQIDFQSVQMRDPGVQAALRGIDELAALMPAQPNLQDLYRRLDELEARLLEQPQRADPAAVAPVMDGAAAIGTAPQYARADHAHPTDASLAPLASPTFSGIVTAPKFRTATGSASAPSGAATTVYAIPNAAPSAYLVHANIGSVGDATNYSAFAVVVADGASARIALSSNGALQTITLSGLNIQTTQSSGSTQTVNATITKVG
jgi:hypothetical protein